MGGSRVKRAIVFWLSCFVALGILVSGLVFLGKPVAKVDLTSALPSPDENLLYIVYTDQNSTLSYLANYVAFSKSFLSNLNLREADVELATLVLVLLKDSKKAALMMYPVDGKLYLAIEPDEEVMPSIELNRLPLKWKEDYPDLKFELNGDRMVIYPSDKRSMWMSLRGKVLLVSSSEEDLILMEQNFDKRDKGKDDSFSIKWSMYKEWPGHLLCHVPANLIPFDSFDDMPFDVELAWFLDGGKLQAKWRLEGIERIFSDEELALLTPQKWSGNYLLPEQRSITLGMTILDTPELARGVSMLADVLGQSSESILEFLKGQMVLTVGGRANIFSIPMPGVLFQFPDRGDIGKTIISGIWQDKLASLRINSNSVAGYESGGAINIPATIIAVANDQMAIMGFISSESLLSGISLKDAFPNVVDREYLMWTDINFASTFNNLKQVLSMERLFNVGDPADEAFKQKYDQLYEFVNNLKNAGRLFVGLNDIYHGELIWELENYISQ
ncbi:hypothetical protein [Acetomicrobium hydrogeniformans]|uniref:DUF3352 domain-containing protein n=1 Tax=Acetomicrobium hydrogeniformans TaxID=649746 RepID=A0A7V6ZEB4_9BACT|nr:hypothetical protein [Acetomicrobium hydrogeniformans]HHZ04278.1 hypothetical protein [Acetomicrobium hydrogeniformans]